MRKQGIKFLAVYLRLSLADYVNFVALDHLRELILSIFAKNFLYKLNLLHFVLPREERPT